MKLGDVGAVSTSAFAAPPACEVRGHCEDAQSRRGVEVEHLAGYDGEFVGGDDGVVVLARGI